MVQKYKSVKVDAETHKTLKCCAAANNMTVLALLRAIAKQLSQSDANE